MLIRIHFLLVVISLLFLNSIECRHAKKQEIIIKTLDDGDSPIGKPYYGSPLKRRHTRGVDKQSTEDSSDSTHISSAEAMNLLKLFGAMAWEADKAEFLSGLLIAFADSDSNVTLVGWQNIHNHTDGKQVDEYRTIELVIPPKPEEDKIGNFVEEDESEEEEDDDDLSDRMIPHNRLRMLKEILEPFNQINLIGSVYFSSFHKDGSLEGYMHVDADELIVEVDDFGLYNKTMTATPEQADDIIERAKKIGRTAILRYDRDGNLIKDKSVIDSLLIGNVIDYYEATDEMLIESPKIMGEIFAIKDTPTKADEDKDKRIMSELIQRFNQKFPNYKWHVLHNPSNYYVTRDVTLSLSFDNMDFYEDTDTYYLVYGTKKE